MDWNQVVERGNDLFSQRGRPCYFDCRDTDSAVILLFQTELKLPDIPIPLLPANITLPIGSEVGWLGFPGIDAQTLCFFSGNISARKPAAYLIDGVAINGVSGGPVVYSHVSHFNSIMPAPQSSTPRMDASACRGAA